MRLTRGTIALLAVALLVIVGVLAFNASPASAPAAPTETPAPTTGGPLFEGLDPAAITRLTVEDYAAGLISTWARDESGAWALEGDASGYEVDATALETKAAALADLEAVDTFPGDTLADYGLDVPSYRIQAAAASGETYTLWVGGMNPTGNRRYVIAETSAASAEATPAAEATAEVGRVTLAGTQQISTVVSGTVQGFVTLLTAPPFLPTPLPTPTPEATAEATADTTPEATEAAN